MNLNHPSVSVALFAQYLQEYSRIRWKQKSVSDYIETRVMKLSFCVTEMIHSNFHPPTKLLNYQSFEQASHDCLRRIKISLRTGKRYNRSILKFYRHLSEKLFEDAKLQGQLKIEQNYLYFKEQLKQLAIKAYVK
jgi:hypothetical protein